MSVIILQIKAKIKAKVKVNTINKNFIKFIFKLCKKNFPKALVKALKKVFLWYLITFFAKSTLQRAK